MITAFDDSHVEMLLMLNAEYRLVLEMLLNLFNPNPTPLQRPEAKMMKV